MRFALLCFMFSVAGCNLLSDQKSNFALVLTEKAKVDPSLVYGCVARWVQSQDVIVLTSEAGFMQGWNGDKNPIFSIQANGRQTRLYVPKSTIKMQNRLEEMISSCSKNPEGGPPTANFWTPFYQVWKRYCTELISRLCAISVQRGGASHLRSAACEPGVIFWSIYRKARLDVIYDLLSRKAAH